MSASESQGDDLTVEELADGLALYQEHVGNMDREQWLACAERWHAQGLDAPENPSPLFGALYDAVAQRDGLQEFIDAAWAVGYNDAEKEAQGMLDEIFELLEVVASDDDEKCRKALTRFRAEL